MSKQKLFEPIINELNQKQMKWSQPKFFNKYRDQVLPGSKAKAPSYISIQSKKNLSPELRDNNFMVFRLGKHHGNGTSFALVQHINGWDDYFIQDNNTFKKDDALNNLDWSQDDLFSFTVLKNFTETSYVNLALSSGILQRALDVDTEISIPATGMGTYSFTVRPHEQLDISWEHNNGQVEIDAMFLGERKGKKTLFVIEAKSGKKTDDSLSKYKLVYPVLSIVGQVDKDIEIVPVYMRTFSTGDHFHFHIAECSMPDPRTEKVYINQLHVIKTSQYKIPKNFKLS